MEKTTELSPEIRKVAQESLQLFKKISNDPNWQHNGSKPCDTYQMEIDGKMASKGVATVSFPFEEIKTFIKSPGSLKAVDPQCTQDQVVAQDKNLRILHLIFSAPWPVSHRDFVTVDYEVVEQGKIYILNKSCNYPLPEQKKLVRGQIIIGGYQLEKIDQNSTKVTYLSFVDIKGSVPQMIKNQTAKNQGQVAGKIFEAMKNRK